MIRIATTGSGPYSRSRFVARPAPHCTESVPTMISSSGGTASRRVVGAAGIAAGEDTARVPSLGALSGGRLSRLCPILAELDDALVGERVVNHLLEDLERQRGDVRSGHGGLGHVQWVPDRGGQDLTLDVVEREDLGQLADDRHAVLVDVVQAAHERRDDARAGLGGEEALVGAEYERAVGLDALFGEARDGLQAVLAHRDLDHDVRGKLGEVAPLGQHSLHVVRDDFGRDRAGGDLADRLEEVVVGAAHLRVEARVGGDPIEDAPPGSGADLFNLGSVEEYLHQMAPGSLGRAWLRASNRALRMARLDPRPMGDRTCLLYTSPSPRDRTRSRMPSSA